jgi:hypothetical protein
MLSWIFARKSAIRKARIRVCFGIWLHTVREYQKETQFLKHLIEGSGSSDSQVLRNSIERAERNERSVLRAVRLVLLLGALSGAGLFFSSLLLSTLQNDLYQFVMTMFCALGLASVACLPVFFILWLFHRIDCNERREECREIIRSLLGKRSSGPFIESQPQPKAATTVKPTVAPTTQEPRSIHMGQALAA